MAKKSKKKPTLKTIAYMTGLAVTTVSRALKDAPDLKASTKERVKLIAEEIGYRPDIAAQRLRTGKTNVISLVIDTEEELFGMASDVITGITTGLRGSSYHLVLTPFLHDDDPMSPLHNIVENKTADGVILSGIKSSDPRIKYLSEAGLPFITHGRSNMGIEHAYYDFDAKAFGRDAAMMLAELGVQKACLVSPPTEYMYASLMQDGFYEGVEQAGLESRMMLFDHTLLSIGKISQSVVEMLSKKSRPQGIVCPSTAAAVGVIGAVESVGLEIGKDIQIVALQSPANALRWFGRNVYAFKEDFIVTGGAMAKSIMQIIDGAPVSEHQTVAYCDNDGGACVLCGNYPCTAECKPLVVKASVGVV